MSVVLLLVFTLSVIAERAVDITLSWVDNNPISMQVSKYRIYQSTSTNNPFVLIREVPATFRSITIKNVAVGYYRWKVSAVNMWGEGSASYAVATPPSYPGPLTNIIYSVGITNNTSNIP